MNRDTFGPRILVELLYEGIPVSAFNYLFVQFGPPLSAHHDWSWLRDWEVHNYFL